MSSSRLSNNIQPDASILFSFWSSHFTGLFFSLFLSYSSRGSLRSRVRSIVANRLMPFAYQWQIDDCRSRALSVFLCPARLYGGFRARTIICIAIDSAAVAIPIIIGVFSILRLRQKERARTGRRTYAYIRESFILRWYGTRSELHGINPLAPTWVTAFVAPYGHKPRGSGTFHDSLDLIVFPNNGENGFRAHLTPPDERDEFRADR